MSATNRSERGGAGVDYFGTPRWCVERIMGALDLPGGHWLEPSAGEGNIIRAVNRDDVKWTAIDLREECRPVLQAAGAFMVQGDFLRMMLPSQFSVAVLNPPFLHALDFVIACLEAADHVVALLRLNWLASGKRATWMRANPPDVYVLPERPSFTLDGKTDATDYAWMHWPPERARSHGRLEVLPMAPRQMGLGVI